MANALPHNACLVFNWLYWQHPASVGEVTATPSNLDLKGACLGSCYKTLVLLLTRVDRQSSKTQLWHA